MDIDLAISPPVVEATYRRVRNDMLQDDPKPRALSRHQASLAVFAAGRRPGQTWAQIRRTWNRENTDRPYETDSRFTKECREAFRRVMGEEINALSNS